jgi:hypothetical protein
VSVEAVSNAEVARRVDDVRAVLAEDIAEIRRALGDALPRELYIARHEALVRRVDTLEAHQARTEVEFRAALEKIEQERRAEIAAQMAEARNFRRFLWSAIILPAASIVITIYQGLQGPA